MPSDEYAGVETGRGSPVIPVDDHPSFTNRISAIPPGTVLRGRLLDLVDQGIKRPLTLVSAPAGFGKTMLLESWELLYDGPATVTRITLDVTTEQPAALLEPVLDGLHRRGSTLSDEPVLFRPEDQPWQSPRTLEGAPDQNVLVLVVDCGNLTIAADFGQNLHRLIHGNAGRVRVVLLTRSDPPLPLHLYRLAGTVTEIRAADLAFTSEEAAALMLRQKLELAPSEVAELQARTDGWPAGLMFAAMNLAGKSDSAQVIREFRGDAGNVAAYLMTEVFEAQPPELREFLLRTCIVDVVRPGLAEALTGHAGDLRTLEFISHGNSFIRPVPGPADCYTYQPLFREFLRAQLLYERPSLAPALHSTAADWFARNDQPLEAILHAITAGDWGRATGYLVQNLYVAGLLVGRRRHQLASLFADLPDDLRGAEAAVVRAAQALADFDISRCTTQLAEARDSLSRQASARRQSGELAITVLQAVSASLGPDLEAGLAATLAAEAELSVASREPAITNPDVTLLVAGCKGRVLLQRGEFPAALAAFTEAITVAEAAGAHEALADFLGMAALVEAVSGHLRRADEVAAHATALADSGAQPHQPRSAIVAEAWVHTDHGDLTAAGDLVHRAAAAAPTHDARVVAAVLALVRARLLRAGGEVGLAGAELRAASNSYGAQDDGWLGQSLIVDEAKTLVAQNQPEEAIRVIEQSQGRGQVESLLVLQRAATETGERGPGLLPAAADRAAALDTRVDGWLVQAAESLRTGDSHRSGLYLERALRLAAPEQLRRPFSEAPPAVRKLLHPTGDLIRHHPWLRPPGQLGGRDRPYGQSRQSRPELVVTTSLTSKEHEVLEYLAELLTTEEIAITMYVSVNTVRSHVRSILRKLNASRRNEAVRRAWELGLLPSRAEG